MNALRLYGIAAADPDGRPLAPGTSLVTFRDWLVSGVRVLLLCFLQGVLVLPKTILVALPAVVVVEEGIHILELLGNFGRRIGCPVVVESLISVVLVLPCFYQLVENAPYSRVKVFCHFLLLIQRISYNDTTVDTTKRTTRRNAWQPPAKRSA